MSFLKSIIVTFSFFTTIPMPMIVWEQKYFRYVPFLLPVVGLVIGSFAFALLYLLQLSELSHLMISIFIVVYFIFITGGLHLDAVMDTCDAHYSRRDRERKLEIMKDSRVGAFAVVGLFCLLTLKIGVIHELLSNHNLGWYLLLVPILSRTMQAMMLYLAPYAQEEGIAALYKPVIKKYDLIVHIIYLISIFLVAHFLGLKVLNLFLVSIFIFLYYRRFAIKQFGGITGDIIGAFLELSELVLLLVILI